jgi:hypothetical protein
VKPEVPGSVGRWIGLPTITQSLSKTPLSKKAFSEMDLTELFLFYKVKSPAEKILKCQMNGHPGESRGSECFGKIGFRLRKK